MPDYGTPPGPFTSSGRPRDARFASPATVAHHPSEHKQASNNPVTMLNRYALSALAVLIVAAMWFLLHRSDEDVILERLEDIRALSEILAPETGIEPLVKARRIGALFGEHTVFDLTNAGYGTIDTGSRDELVRRIVHGRTRLVALELRLQDARVSIEDDTAQVRLRGSALGTLRGQQEPFLEIHTVEVLLRREADTWLVTGARHLRDERQP